jgi:gamma-glutamylcyclotransferase (GGCT)/AIG2-like uncharacterized protein YtfP
MITKMVSRSRIEMNFFGKHRLFVYGTLKKGFRNSYLLRNAKFISQDITVDDDFLMVNLGRAPGLIKTDLCFRGYRVCGEVYELSTLDLLKCDILELNGIRYRRELVGLTGQDELVWIYIYKYNPKKPNRTGVKTYYTENTQTWVGFN